MSWQVLQGDCIKVMAEMEEASVDAVVCDPPYGLEFMGKEWDRLGVAGKQPQIGAADGSKFRERRGTPSFTDAGNPTCQNCGGDKYRNGPRKCRCGRSNFGNPGMGQMHRMQEWHQRWAEQSFRILKPGGCLLAFGGTRTYHRLASAIEDAGFEIRDSILWLYGSGFPKSLNVGKANTGRVHRHPGDWNCLAEPALAELGTALKPSHEPIVVARKPLIGTVAENVLEHGTGGINVDGCRVAGANPSVDRRETARNSGNAPGRPGEYGDTLTNRISPERYMEDRPGEQLGRWPANVVLSHTEDCELVGVQKVKAITGGTGNHDGSVYGSRSNQGDEVKDYSDEDGMESVEAWDCAPGCPVAGTEREGIGYQGGLGNRVANDTHGDSGGASRFFATFPADKLCALCSLSCVESAAIHSPQSDHLRATALEHAPGAPPPESEVTASASDTSASTAEPSLRTTQPIGPTAASSAPPDAPEQLAEWIVRLASGAVSLCEPCAMNTARSVARLLADQTPASLPGPGSMPERRRQILSRDLALIAAGSRSTGITPTIETLSALNGSAVLATDPAIQRNAKASATDQTRFRYQSKTSRAERNAGLEGFPDVEGGMRSETSGQHLTRRDGGDPGPTKNGHPTVKPINLMRWLVRLVTPPGGTCLDPFLGSGTTGCAAVLEGFDFIGIERESEYIAIAEARIAFWAEHKGREIEDVLGLYSKSQRESKAHADRGQITLEEAAA